MKLSWGTGLVVGLSLAACVGFGWSRARVKKTNVDGVGWYASFSDALSEAKQTHKPILLLSMFGQLDEEMPCANARTLRATLFKDPEFKKFATTDVIPTWEMVRAVPKVQIDLGDGHKITRTVRGNAVMYLCNPDGKVVDAFPGVYTRGDFMPAIRESVAMLAHADFQTVVAYHKERGFMIPPSFTTATKAVVEAPTLNLIGAKRFPGAAAAQTSQGVPSDRQLFLRAAAQLSDLSLTPMTPEETITKVTGSPIEAHDPVVLSKEVLQTDSTINLTRTRPVIHLWLASEKQLPTPEQARDTVLQTVLKIPFKDPYFGLRDVLMPGTTQ